MRRMNEMTAGEDAELAARISSYELAFRMQQHAPEAVDLSKESKETKKLYLHRVLDNREITPAYIRQQTENFCANIKNTGDVWKFVGG